jgi:DNA-binding MarR family transcriptional regulator
VLVLVAIQERPGIAPGALADRLGLQRSEISRLVHELHYEGWLEVKRNPYASRGLVITPVGGEAIARAGRAALHSVDRRLRLNLSRLRKQQLEVCLELLKGPRTPVADALSGL